jgi:hypothetical protein
VLLLKDAGCEAVFVVGIEHRDCFLQNDGAVVEFFVHEVHSTTRNFHAVREGLFLRLKSGERGQQ